MRDPDRSFPQYRQRCRNPHCGAQLPVPTDDARAAFCCKGCRVVLYHWRCLVCEKPLGRRSPRQWFCSKRRQSQFHRDRFPPLDDRPLKTPILRGFGPTQEGARYPHSGRGTIASRSAHSARLKIGFAGDRPWRVVAGSAPPAINLQIPLDPETAARTWRANDRYRLEASVVTPKDWPLNLVGGSVPHRSRGRLDPDLRRFIVNVETSPKSADAVLRAMRDGGATLHLHFGSWRGAVWTLSNGTAVSPVAAELVTKNFNVVCVGNA